NSLNADKRSARPASAPARPLVHLEAPPGLFGGPIALLAAAAGVREDEVDVWRGFRHHEDLVREERLAQADQPEVERERHASQGPVAKDRRERGGNAAHLLDAEPGVEQQPPEGPEGEQPGMRAIENPGLAVVELAEREHDALHAEGDVGG